MIENLTLFITQTVHKPPPTKAMQHQEHNQQGYKARPQGIPWLPLVSKGSKFSLLFFFFFLPLCLLHVSQCQDIKE